MACGCIAEHHQGYDVPFAPMATLLLVGALLWLRIDASKALT